MSEGSAEDLDNLADFSPEMIAHEIFTKDPKDPCSHQILAYQDGADLTYIYEILITILVEGLNILTGGLREADLSDFTKSHITALNPWFQSLGFNINVEAYDETDKENYKEYYCRTLINNKLHETLFLMKNMPNKTYHFFLNGSFLDQNKSKTELKDIYGIFAANGFVYRISFEFYIPINDIPINKIL